MAKEYPIVRPEDVSPEPVSVEGGWRKIDIRFIITGEREGSKNCTMFRALFPPGARHMKHSHAHSDELFYVIRGARKKYHSPVREKRLTHLILSLTGVDGFI